MSTEIERAVEFYNKACLAEEQGQITLAEVYYLKSSALFEQIGGSHMLAATKVLKALASLRESGGDHEGALYSAKKAAQITQV